ncbi:uncharacterized protein LOC143623425 [Bidens hawaiensis]|uniref:uncharacterized protein LOC143623425 n=1 Tax=Bidens hawaiensis TaxID=980011 RepID=UPI004048F231
MEIEGRRDMEERPINPNDSSTDWPFTYFKFNRERDSAEQVRNAILVVAALVANASYQAMMSFPDALKERNNSTKLMFIAANTLSWSSSFIVIEMLTSSFPFQRELRLSYFFMGFTYGIIALAQVGDGIPKIIASAILILCAFLPWLLRRLPICIKNMYVDAAE